MMLGRIRLLDTPTNCRYNDLNDGKEWKMFNLMELSMIQQALQAKGTKGVTKKNEMQLAALKVKVADQIKHLIDNIKFGDE